MPTVSVRSEHISCASSVVWHVRNIAKLLVSHVDHNYTPGLNNDGLSARAGAGICMCRGWRIRRLDSQVEKIINSLSGSPPPSNNTTKRMVSKQTVR